MNYRSVASLNRDIRSWLDQLPRDLDVIVGIPRSGLLVANMLCLHLNLPLADLEGFCEGRILTSGERSVLARRNDILKTTRNVLIVDDSVATGKQMSVVKDMVGKAQIPHKICYAATYVMPEVAHLVDFFFEVIPYPRVFEWNVMHQPYLERFCVDIDGVLCRDPTEEENDDGPRYRNFLETVPPKIVPTHRIGWLVTCRLEKYRELTEGWLAKHGIRYNNLIMMDFPDKASRVAAASYASFKKTIYESTGASLFIESSSKSAEKIAKLSGLQVLDMETGELIDPSLVDRYKQKGRRFLERLLKRIV